MNMNVNVSIMSTYPSGQLRIFPKPECFRDEICPDLCKTFLSLPGSSVGIL